MGLPVLPLLNVTFPHYNIMEGLFRKGWAANAVQVYMSDLGMGYRRTTVQKVRRKVLDVLKFESFYRALSPDKLPHKNMIEEFSWNRHEKYKIMYTFDVIDLDTGETFQQLGCHYDNNYLTEREYGDLIDVDLDPKRYVVNGVITNIQITQLTHRKGYPW